MGISYSGTAVNYFELVETLSPSNVATITSTATLTGYTALLITYSVTNNDAGNAQHAFRFNSDAGANYDYQRVSGASTSSDTGQTSLRVGGNTTQTNGQSGFMYVMVNQQGADFVHGSLIGAGRFNGAGSAYGAWRSNNAISSVTFMENGSLKFTGTVKIYGIK